MLNEVIYFVPHGVPGAVLKHMCFVGKIVCPVMNKVSAMTFDFHESGVVTLRLVAGLYLVATTFGKTGQFLRKLRKPIPPVAGQVLSDARFGEKFGADS